MCGFDGGLGGWWSGGELVFVKLGGGCEIVKFFHFAKIYFFCVCIFKNANQTL